MSTPKIIIFETENFFVSIPSVVFVSRVDGGHVTIKMKDPVADRTQLSPSLAIEYTRVSMIVGKALLVAMNLRGIPVVNVNYLDMGNWAWKESPAKPKMHMHILGRSKDAKKQVFPEAVNLPPKESGFYDNHKPLNDEDIAEIRRQIEIEASDEKYSPTNWLLS